MNALSEPFGGARNEYIPRAFAASAALHALLLTLVIFGFGHRSPNLSKFVVYSVTLESGSTRGGVTQIPDSAKPQTPPPAAAAQPKPEAKAAVTEKRAEKPQPAVKKEAAKEEKPEVILPGKKQVEKTAAAKGAAKPPAAPKAPTAAEIDRSYEQAMKRYFGASTNAGGRGFGGDGRGGTGMGGGLLRPPEWLLYKDKMESYVKQGWKWHETNAELSASVQFRMSPAGVITDVRLARGSGNANFDDSVLRAVSKASPAPAPPPQFYDDFSFIEIEFRPE
jgi:colicin import membrane protein